MKFSVISVYNDREILSECLLSSLSQQSFNNIERILIDNRERTFSSAASALNHGAKRAKGDYYVFAHQDVKFDSDFFEEVERQLSLIDNLGIAGFAGVEAVDAEGTTQGVNEIYHGEDRRLWEQGNEIQSPSHVESVDELLFIIPSEVFNSRRLNESICSGWHLYSVEYSMYINHRSNKEAVVLPVSLWHRSDGGWRDIKHDLTCLKLAHEYSDVNWIHTTGGSWPTSRIWWIRRITKRWRSSKEIHPLHSVKDRFLNQTNRPKMIDKILFFLWERNLIKFDHLYNEKYYKKLARNGIPGYANILAQNIISELSPNSAIELGTGVAQFPAALKKRGVNVAGVDGSKKAKMRALIDSEEYFIHDLTTPYEPDETYDVCLSIELLEHLPKESADVIVRSLTRLAPVVIVTAATPGQGGTHHVNEQPREFWIERFRSRGYSYNPDLSQRLLNGISNEILNNNLMVFEQG